MKMQKPHQILAGLLIVQLLLVVLVYWPRTTTSSTGDVLLGAFQAADVNRLTISDGNKNKVELAKEGDKWVIANADYYPAQASKITPMLEKLTKIRNNRLVTETDSSHKRLKVAANEFERLIEISLANGTTTRLYVGTSGGPSATHVRVNDDVKVYLTGELAVWDAGADATNWIDNLFVTIPQTATLGLAIANGNGTFQFAKNGDKWVMQGLGANDTFNEPAFTSLLNQALSLRITKPIGKSAPSTPLNQGTHAIVTIQTKDGPQSIQIGAKDEKDNTYIAKWSGSEYYVRVASGIGDNFTNKKRDDFLQKPATPTP